MANICTNINLCYSLSEPEYTNVSTVCWTQPLLPPAGARFHAFSRCDAFPYCAVCDGSDGHAPPETRGSSGVQTG